MIDAKNLMVGNIINRKFYNPNPTNPSWELEKCEIVGLRTNSVIARIKGGSHSVLDYWEGVPLTEYILVKCGFGVITENSSGKRYSYLNDGVYDSDLCLTYWETTKNKGKFFRRDIEFKYLHELQNLFKILTKKDLEVKL